MTPEQKQLGAALVRAERAMIDADRMRAAEPTKDHTDAYLERVSEWYAARGAFRDATPWPAGVEPVTHKGYRT